MSTLFESLIILTFIGSPKPGGIRFVNGTQVVGLPVSGGKGFQRTLTTLLHLPLLIQRIYHHTRNSDVLYIPVPGDIPLIGFLFGIVMRKRLIVRYGSSWVPNDQTTLMNRVVMAAMRLFAGNRNVMLVSGQGIQPPAAQVHWLFSTAISEAELDAIQPDLNRFSNLPLRLAYIGRLSPEKGVPVLLDSLAILKQEGFGKESLQLDLIGDGPARAGLERMTGELGLEGEVHFVGQLSREELIERLTSTDLCVLPSLTEGFPKARLDAFLCGVPVLTTEVGYGREVVGPNNERGWVVPAGNVQALASALQAILETQPDWPGFRRRCRLYAERFTLEGWAREIGRICSSQWKLAMIDGRLSSFESWQVIGHMD
ncbi:MAG TPA: glycosyltransferase [Anaerolineaceae bacterium]|nr:glycosyltransferase [Anaerolineaceae bacterium]